MAFGKSLPGEIGKGIDLVRLVPGCRPTVNHRKRAAAIVCCAEGRIAKQFGWTVMDRRAVQPQRLEHGHT